MIEDLYLFCYGLALLLLSATTVGVMTAIWCIIVMHFKNKERKEHDRKEQTEDDEHEKRRKRNAEIINKYLR